MDVPLTEELHSYDRNHHSFGKAKQSSQWRFELVLCNVYKYNVGDEKQNKPKTLIGDISLETKWKTFSNIIFILIMGEINKV